MTCVEEHLHTTLTSLLEVYQIPKTDTSIFCIRSGGHYSLLANARQIYGATAIKSVRVIARKTTMTIEAAGLSGSGR